MHKMLFGVFEKTGDANSALSELYKAGFSKEDISIIVQDSVAQEGILKEQSSAGEKATTGLAAGGATGAALGALAGFLVGVGAIALPGIGGLLAAGPIAAALGLTGAAATTATGAIGGALAGGLVGALVKLGIPEENAITYEKRIKEGNVLLAIRADSEKERKNAEEALQNNSAGEINYYTVA